MNYLKKKTRREFTCKIYLFLLTFLCVGGSAWADTHYVDTGGTNTPPYNTLLTAAHIIQDAIDAASDGDTVDIAAGTYNERLEIKGKYIILQGADTDTTIIHQDLSVSNVINIGNVTTTTASSRLVIQDLTVEGGDFGSIEFGRIGPANHVTLERLDIKDGYRGVEFHNTYAVTDVIIQSCEISNVGKQAIRMSTGADIDGLVIESCDIHDNVTAGLYSESPFATNIQVNNTDFTNCSLNSHSNADIVLTGFLGNVSFNNVDIISSNSDTGIRVSGEGGPKVDGEGTALGPAGNISFSNVTISGTQGCVSATCSNGKFPYGGAGIALGRYNDSSTISFNNVMLNSTALYGLHLGTMEGSATLDIAGVTFSGTFDQNIYLGSHGNRDDYRKSTVNVDATDAVFDNIIACNDIEIESTVYHQFDDPTLGLVTWECGPDCEPITGNEIIDESVCVVDGIYVDSDTGLATHGAYMKKVVLMANELFRNGDIDQRARREIINRAAQSDVNKP